jgi:hypothetical protein
VVILRNLTINGAGTGIHGINIIQDHSSGGRPNRELQDLRLHAARYL